ncbi:MAG: hypothetical protein V2A79_15140 [Planctomycetota bacterium]
MGARISPAYPNRDLQGAAPPNRNRQGAASPNCDRQGTEQPPSADGGFGGGPFFPSTWLTRAPWSATTLALALCLTLAGCGAGTADGFAGSGGAVTLGPHSIGDGTSDAGDQSPDGGTPTDGDGGSNSNSPDSDGAPGPDAGTNGDGNSNDNTGGVDGLDACFAVSGRAFFAPNASLSFVDDTFIWTIAGMQTVGTFACAGLDLTGGTEEGDVLSGRYDPLTDTVLWEGLIYRTRPLPAGP